MIERPATEKETNFNNAAEYYDQEAVVQNHVANRLIASLEPWKDILPPGPVLEIGCGTGFVSRKLPELFPERRIIFTDEAPNMVDKCKTQFELSSRFEFDIHDAETIPVSEPTYAMTISNFVAQWFRDPAYTLGQWLEVTKPGGLLLAAFPGSESFPEWRKHARSLGIPFTGNTLPDTEEMVIKLSSAVTQVDYYEDTVTQNFACAADFFHHLKKIGAGKQLSGRPLTLKEMSLLINHWDAQTEGDITVSYHIIFMAVKKNITPKK